METKEYQYNLDIISLSIGNLMFYPEKGRIAFDLFSDDPDEADETLLKCFGNIFCDLVAEFSEKHVVMYSALYKKIKSESKRWFSRGWKCGKYNTKGATSKLKQFLIDSSWSDGLYADITDYYEEKGFWGAKRDYRKNLFILQEKLDMNLFMKTDMSFADESTYGNGIDIFRDSKILNSKDVESTIRHYINEEKPIVELATDTVLPRIGIAIDEKYIQKQDCIEIIKHIVEKHNKKLEVNI